MQGHGRLLAETCIPIRRWQLRPCVLPSRQVSRRELTRKDRTPCLKHPQRDGTELYPIGTAFQMLGIRTWPPTFRSAVIIHWPPNAHFQANNTYSRT
jgi:hypothetical protein